MIGHKERRCGAARLRNLAVSTGVDTMGQKMASRAALTPARACPAYARGLKCVGARRSYCAVVCSPRNGGGRVLLSTIRFAFLVGPLCVQRLRLPVYCLRE